MDGFRFITAGESHGPSLGAVGEGVGNGRAICVLFAREGARLVGAHQHARLALEPAQRAAAADGQGIAVDHLRGLKENVIMGRLIPAGTGLERYRNFRLLTETELPAPELELTEGIPGEEGIPPSPGIAAELMDEDEARPTQ